ncbi:MAG: hypothetical protein FGM48_05970 [Candidatus Nanopelagicaceae bacterium]|nr:hypothetical protein [Candidatus Nanopelagicaceae bacterium]
MKLRKVITSFIIFLHLIANTNFADAQSKFSDCLLEASSNQAVSLGKPLAKERLGGKAKLKIGVIPFNFSDSPTKILSESDKSDYQSAVKKIEEISDGNVKIDLHFLPTINANISIVEFKSKYVDQDKSWSDSNLPNSTWGFIKKLIQSGDDYVNYSGFDSVVFEGNNTNKSISGAEAFDFFESSEGNNFGLASSEYFRTVKTNEGFINNAVFLDSHKSPNTIAHELFHNFGLTDLYGGSPGPGLMSLMSAGAPRLLNYERAVLGWFPIEQFKCSNIENYLNLQQVSNKIELNDLNQESILLLKKSDSEAYLVEVTKYEGKSILLVYLLEQEKRPPITLSWNPKLTYFSVYDLRDPNNIGSYYVTEDFNLVIVNSVGRIATLNLIPRALVYSEEAKKLISESLINREVALSKASEAKAKFEMETKVTATPSPTQSKIKQTTITCFKGKAIKKVSSVNPKCPAGYKKK